MTHPEATDPQHTPKFPKPASGKNSGSKDSPKAKWTTGNPKVGTDQHTPTYQVGKGVGK